MIVPVMEETAVVSKELILKQEIRITKLQEFARYRETVPRRAEEINIERLPSFQVGLCS